MITDNVIDKLTCSSYSPTPGHSREVLLDHLYSNINRDIRHLENVLDKLIQKLVYRLVHNVGIPGRCYSGTLSLILTEISNILKRYSINLYKISSSSCYQLLFKHVRAIRENGYLITRGCILKKNT